MGARLGHCFDERLDSSRVVRGRAVSGGYEEARLGAGSALAMENEPAPASLKPVRAVMDTLAATYYGPMATEIGDSY